MLNESDHKRVYLLDSDIVSELSRKRKELNCFLTYDSNFLILGNSLQFIENSYSNSWFHFKQHRADLEIMSSIKAT